MISRAELAELFAEDDRQRAEHREWLARREAHAASLVRRNDNPAGLVFKTTDNALLDAPAPEPETSGEEFCFSSEQFDCLAAALDMALKHEANRMRAEQKAAIAPLEREIAYL